MPITEQPSTRSRSRVLRPIALTVAPVALAVAALAGAAAPASADTTPTASTVTESFGGPVVANSAWRALGDGCLTKATAAPAPGASSLGVCALRVGSPAASASTGYLQLTDASGNRKGGAVFTRATPSSLGLDVTFDQWQYGKNTYGGDGIAFFVADGTASITAPGGLGGALGYAQNTNQPAAPNGVAGGYLGVGLDVHGVFATSQDGHGTGCTTGQSTTMLPNTVVLRGPGSGKNGYCSLATTTLPSTQKLHLTVPEPTVVTPSMARRFRVTVSADRLPTVTVYAAFTPGATPTQVLRHTMTTPAPATYQFGFTAASGSVSDTHLIGNVTASTLTPPDTTPPVVTISGGAKALVASASPTVSGTTDNPAGSTMDVVVGTQKLSTTVGDHGAWSVRPTGLAEGPVTVTASTKDEAGNVGTATQTLTVDTVAPVVTIAGGASATTTSSTPTLSGTTDASDGTTVDVTVAGQKLSTTAAAGAWSVSPDTIENGTVPVTAQAKDAAGNVGSATQSLTVAAPALAIEGGAKALTNVASPTIRGTSAGFAGRTVTVVVAGRSLTGTVGAKGTWSVAAGALSEGGHQVTARVSSAAGLRASATQKLTVDTVAPSVVIDGGSSAATRSSTATISGRVNLPEGSTVRVELDGDAKTATVSATRTWSVTPSSLTVGAHTVVASATDPAGNVGTRRQRLVLVPALSVDGGKSRLTKDATPTISGTSDAPAGTAVTVAVADRSLTTTVSGSGTWSVEPDKLTSTVHPVLATLRDAYGNTRTARQTLTVDTVAPSIVIDGGSRAKTTSHTPTLSGRVNVPAGADIEVAVDGKARTVTVSSTRTWSVTCSTLGTGTHTVVVTATDAAGNVGTRQQQLKVTA